MTKNRYAAGFCCCWLGGMLRVLRIGQAGDERSHRSILRPVPAGSGPAKICRTRCGAEGTDAVRHDEACDTKSEEKDGITYYTLESTVQKCEHSPAAVGTVRIFQMGWKNGKIVKFTWGGPKGGKVEY